MGNQLKLHKKCGSYKIILVFTYLLQLFYFCINDDDVPQEVGK